uniref:Nucleolar GTP-binding protein 2 (Trinotate prediction) n=1 Tax=Myxobolus squamalis TaxID=59785 RepID=A0A6B2FXF8_MYXSQ
MKRIFLIDCPGVVYSTNDSESEIIMKGVVRVEYIKEPSQYISHILDQIRPEYLSRTYGVIDWLDALDFLQKLAHKSGRLLKGGEPDIETVSKMIINDFQRGKLPYFVPPPIPTTSDVASITSVITMEEQKLEEIEHTTEFSQKHVDALS